jgi:hypothetical protein
MPQLMGNEPILGLNNIIVSLSILFFFGNCFCKMDDKILLHTKLFHFDIYELSLMAMIGKNGGGIKIILLNT